jgi:hypothetical protein
VGLIAETRDPAIINHFAAHPEIAPHIGGPLDFTAAIRETAVYLFGEHGGFCYEWCAPGTYEGHVMLTEAGRGQWGLNAGKQSIRMMEERGATHLWCRIHPDDRRTALFVRWCGFEHVGDKTLNHPEPGLWRIFDWRSECPL